MNKISTSLKKDKQHASHVAIFFQVFTGLFSLPTPTSKVNPPLANQSLRCGKWASKILMTLALLLTFCVHQSPGYIIASDTYTAELNNLLNNGQIAAEQKRWDEAKNCFKKALDKADYTKKEIINAKLQWCTANSMLHSRYKDGSVVEHVKKIKPGQSGKILNETWELISQNFYKPVDMNALMSQGLWQLQALTENPEIYQQYSVNVEKLEQLKAKIITLRNALSLESKIDEKEINAIVNMLCNLSDEAGLGKSWPCIELAYAMSDSLGKYSYLLSPKQYISLCDQLQGEYVGIGIDLIFQEDYPLIYDVVPGSPADNCGLLPGDIIISINQTSIHSNSPEFVSKLLSGSHQSQLKLSVKRQEDNNAQKIKTFSLKRKAISSSTVRYSRVLPDTKIGFLRVANFGHNTAWEMRQAIDKLINKGASSLLIDLRNNGGGVLTSAVDAVRLFINSGTIVTVKSGNNSKKYKAGGDNFYSYDLPLIILVDENTASAAEIFCAALKDNKRATVIGSKTFGKAVVQSIYKIDSAETALCITTSTYLPPSNIGFNHIGIIPDFTIKKGIKQPFKPLSVLSYISLDNSVMQKAMQLLTHKVSSL